MTFYLDGEFQPEYLDWVAAIHSEEYYVNMMIAWYFATALADNGMRRFPMCKECRLEPGHTVRPFRRPWRVTGFQTNERHT